VNSAFGGIRYYGFITMKLMYVAYIIWGYYLSKSVIHINKIVSSIVFIVFFGGLVVYQVLWSNMGEIYSVWYSNPVLYISSIFLSLILFRFDSFVKMPFLEKISSMSFGIYLVHVPIMKIIQSSFSFLAIPSIFNFVVFFFLSLIISVILILVIMKVPIIGKKLFYIK
jgi:surface polysaccharide O-acyltransferase-like enzyme